MPTIDQIRAARALLNWSQGDLADRAGLSQTGVARIESGINMPNSSTLDKITSAFDDAGIEFIADRGVEKRRLEFRVFSGDRGYEDFFDDVYQTVKELGGQILISGVIEKEFDKHFSDGGLNHRSRMTKLENFTMQCLVCEGDYNFTANAYCQYRWTPAYLFESVPFYVYGNKLALLIFTESEVNVYVVRQKRIADAFRKQFSIQWETAIIPPERASQ